MEKYAEFIGIDVSIEISLLEYGLIIRKNLDVKENEYEYQYIVKNELGFFVGGVDEKFIDEKITDLTDDSFYKSIGCSYFHFLQLPIVQRISDLLSYYGYDEIFGYGIWDTPMTVEQINERFEMCLELTGC